MFVFILKNTNKYCKLGVVWHVFGVCLIFLNFYLKTYKKIGFFSAGGCRGVTRECRGVSGSLGGAPGSLLGLRGEIIAY